MANNTFHVRSQCGICKSRGEGMYSKEGGGRGRRGGGGHYGGLLSFGVISTACIQYIQNRAMCWIYFVPNPTRDRAPSSELNLNSGLHSSMQTIGLSLHLPKQIPLELGTELNPTKWTRTQGSARTPGLCSRTRLELEHMPEVAKTMGARARDWTHQYGPNSRHRICKCGLNSSKGLNNDIANAIWSESQDLRMRLNLKMRTL